MKTAYYNLALRPATWDFLSFAILAKLDGCDQIHIVSGDRASHLAHYSPLSVAQRVSTIHLPLAHAINMNAVYELAPNRSDSPYKHNIRAVVERLPLPFDIQGDGNPDTQALYDNVVTITIREQSFQPLRNSRMEEWIQAAGRLRNQGFRVVFIPDHERPDRKFEDFEVLRKPSMGTRIDVYKSALVNFFIPNGPIILPLYFPIRAVVMHPVYEEYPNSNWRFWKKMGVEEGEQPKWWDRDRLLWWYEDDMDAILRAFDEWMVGVRC